MANNNNTKNLNVPNLRFPEFKGEWKKKHLSELVGDIKDRISTSSLSVDNYVSTENILQNFQGVTLATSLPHNTNVTAFRKDDILFSNIRPYLKKIWYASYDGGCSTDVFVFRNSGMCSAMFLYHLIANDKFINYVMLGTKGTKMPRGDKQQIIQYVVYLPSKLEQNKIATFLSLLDSRIEAQIKIIEKYKSLIKGIRYYILEESTHYNYLGNLCDIIKGHQVNLDNLLKHGKYYVMNGGTQPSGYYNSYNTNAGTISISEGGNSCGYVQYNKENFWSGGHCYTLQNIKGELTEKYLYHYLKSNEKMIMALRVGSGLPNIQKKDLMSLRIPIPAKENQKKISCLLDSIEDKISVETNVMTKFMQQKQYLLANLFI
ncbi:restriction endonuclease subunit S [Bacteroides acidifaciens]|uniref:Putative type-1 restriction enzyme specificity protein MG438 n=2 Tax=Bacteroides acidifaciens TaxID=85831 RepID=A0A7K3MMF5_9BACE|nr:restriction endonuclease subunit S [Bacteroides acidifaciens]NDO54855.1 restriction endonuclease subunit S [Bacteroides acidifaciens]GFH87292.1 putative type-1 restriction enzyme specificity protein MG438 [Bacteroides acidifaciens]